MLLRIVQLSAYVSYIVLVASSTAIASSYTEGPFAHVFGGVIIYSAPTLCTLTFPFIGALLWKESRLLASFVWGFAVIELLGHAIILTAALSNARAAAVLTVGAWLTGMIAFYHPHEKLRAAA